MGNPEARDEWEAWQSVVIKLRELGVEINDENALNDCLTQWARAYNKLQESILI